MEKDTSLCLGIDIGTTSIKASLIGQDGTAVQEPVSTPSNASMPSVSALHVGSEQNIWLIFKAIQDCLSKVGPEKLKLVRRIGVTGQMHGCVLWKSKSVSIEDGSLCIKSDQISPLFNWQDGRCSSSFLATLPEPESHLSVATGYGCATLFWWVRNHPEYLDQFDHAGTVMDLFVAVLCSEDEPVISVQNAASWGYFNCHSNAWNNDILSASGFPTKFLPKVQDPGSLAGSMKSSWLGLAAGTSVSVAMGDLPCAIYSVLKEPTDAVVNIGTSAQLVHAMPDDFRPPQTPPPVSPVAHFAYFDGKYLAVAASLNGGNVLSTVVDSLLHWCTQLGIDGASRKVDMFAKVIELAKKSDTDLVVDPLLLGERHRQDERGRVSNLTTDNIKDLGGVFRAVCRGIITNLASMLTKDELRLSGVNRIVGCGSALIQNAVLKEELEKCFELPVLYRDDSDACLGAALYVQSATWT